MKFASHVGGSQRQITSYQQERIDRQQNDFGAGGIMLIEISKSNGSLECRSYRGGTRDPARPPPPTIIVSDAVIGWRGLRTCKGADDMSCLENMEWT
jgi:hypothetical protein